MGRIELSIDDELLNQASKHAIAVYGGRGEDLSRAVSDGLRLWIRSDAVRNLVEVASRPLPRARSIHTGLPQWSAMSALSNMGAEGRAGLTSLLADLKDDELLRMVQIHLKVSFERERQDGKRTHP